MTRRGEPIETVAVKHSIATGIAFGNIQWPLWDAIINCGGTLEDLWLMERGEKYNTKFFAKVIAWYGLKNQIELHKGDASAAEAEKRMKRKR